MFHKLNSLLVLLTLVQCSPKEWTTDTQTIQVDDLSLDDSYEDVIIPIVVTILIMILCRPCFSLSNSISPPINLIEGEDDRWPNDILNKTAEWLAKAEKRDGRIVNPSQYKWPEVNPVEFDVPVGGSRNYSSPLKI